MLDKRILVTGGTGFIGKHLISKLVTRSIHIRVMAFDSADGCINTSVEYVRGNYLDENGHQLDSQTFFDNNQLILRNPFDTNTISLLQYWLSKVG